MPTAKGPAPTPSRPPQKAWTGESLRATHGWEADSVDQQGGKLRFTDGHWIDYLPPGQWLVAMENCQQGHTVEDTGDPCWCGSDNCGFCVKCGVEDHD